METSTRKRERFLGAAGTSREGPLDRRGIVFPIVGNGAVVGDIGGAESCGGCRRQLGLGGIAIADDGDDGSAQGEHGAEQKFHGWPVFSGDLVS